MDRAPRLTSRLRELTYFVHFLNIKIHWYAFYLWIWEAFDISFRSMIPECCFSKWNRNKDSTAVFWHTPLKYTLIILNVLCLPLSFINSKMLTLIWYHSNINRISNLQITLLHLPKNYHHKREKPKLAIVC